MNMNINHNVVMMEILHGIDSELDKIGSTCEQLSFVYNRMVCLGTKSKFNEGHK